MDKKCERCGHSRAAHVDEVRCALCGCTPRRDTFVQQSLGFRSAIPLRVSGMNGRKR